MKKKQFILTLAVTSLTIAGCGGTTDEVPEEEVIEAEPGEEELIETDGSPLEEPDAEAVEEPIDGIQEETVEEETDEVLEEPADSE